MVRTLSLKAYVLNSWRNLKLINSAIILPALGFSFFNRVSNLKLKAVSFFPRAGRGLHSFKYILTPRSLCYSRPEHLIETLKRLCERCLGFSVSSAHR